MVKSSQEVEKRLKQKRNKCPQKVQERIGRANTERMVVMKQGPVVKSESKGRSCKFQVAGSTGNVYKVNIGKLPTCTCPDFEKRQDACKHTLFVLLKIIGLDIDDNLLYQKAFLSSELKTLFKRMERNKHSASRYIYQGGDQEDEMDDLICGLTTTHLEEDDNGRAYGYTNVRRLTGQPSERDSSSYRPYHWEKPPYIRYN